MLAIAVTRSADAVTTVMLIRVQIASSMYSIESEQHCRISWTLLFAVLLAKHVSGRGCQRYGLWRNSEDVRGRKAEFTC